jgi:peptide/nickel transport system substrate-binding protein
MYESYEPGVSVAMTKNPNYFTEGMPYLDGIEFKVIEDDEARRTALVSGAVDMIEYLDFQSIPDLRKDSNIAIPESQGFYGHRLMFDFTVPPVDDVLVRKALNFALDRQTLADTIIAGEATPIWGSMIPKGRFGYNPDLDNTYSYDPEKAISLLAEAGWEDTDGDGTLDKDGEQLVITMATYGPSYWSQIGELLQENLRSIGVVLELDVTPWATYEQKIEANKVLPLDQVGSYNIFHETIWGLDMSDYSKYVLPGGFNYGRYTNPEVQDMIRQALATNDDAEREKMFQDIQALVMEDAPWIAPVWISRAEGVRSHVQNFYHLNETGCYGILLWEAYFQE